MTGGDTVWECVNCHEQIEPEFEFCWNCGTSKDGARDPAFRTADQPDLRDENTPVQPGPATDAPDLPRPLSDPLLAVQRIVAALFVLQVALIFLSSALAPRVPSTNPPATVGGLANLAGVLPYVFLLTILPVRRVNAFYLRSFRNDRRSWAIRQVARDALGGQFRLSGIRDPSRRMNIVLRFLAYAVFLLRYATPKYMNLEAGPDWKARLWRSLGQARCAFVDLTEMTRFVEEEAALCYHCLGPRRVLFIGGPSLQPDGWRKRLAALLGLDAGSCEALHVAVWQDGHAVDPEFRRTLASFVGQIPAGTAGLNNDYMTRLGDSVLPEAGRDAEEARQTLQIGVGVVLALVISWLLQVVLQNRGGVPALGRVQGLAFVPPFALLGYLLVLFAGYVRDCGSRTKQAVEISLFGVTFLLPIVAGLMLPSVETVRAGVYAAESRWKLANIGLALHNYQDVYGRMPAAAIDGPNGEPGLSWRVAILPFVDERQGRELYSRFRLDEPWDGRHNSRLVERMPAVFALPGTPAAPGQTYYQALVGPGAAFEGTVGPHVPSSFPDGAATTILVAEAARPVPWTKPEDLEVGDAGVPPFGSHFGGGFHAVMADGSVRRVKAGTSATTLRAAVTARNGDVLGPDW